MPVWLYFSSFCLCAFRELFTFRHCMQTRNVLLWKGESSTRELNMAIEAKRAFSTFDGQVFGSMIPDIFMRRPVFIKLSVKHVSPIWNTVPNTEIINFVERFLTIFPRRLNFWQTKFFDNRISQNCKNESLMLTPC